MARRFIKSALKVGTYHSSDGQVEVTPQRIKHWADGFAKLSAAKYAVPTDWDHGDDIALMQPVKMSGGTKKRRSAENTVGRLADFKLAADGQSAELTVELTDPKAAGRAERNEVYISPVILDKWRDGHGTEYSDVITHVDLVNHPVDHSQGPFVEAPKSEPGVVALALRQGLGKPAAIRLGDNPFAKKDGDGDGETGEGASDAGKAAPPDAEDNTNPDMPEDAGDDQQLEAVIAHLRNDGYGLPADTDASNLVERLLTACLTKEASNQKAEAEAAKDKDESDPDEENDMSVADPGYQAMSLALHNMHRDQLKQRLDNVLESGRCNSDEHTRLSAAVGAVRLSLDTEGKQLTKSDLEQWLESREAVPQGTFWDAETRTRKLSLTAAEPAKGMGSFEEFSAAEAEQTVNFALGRKAAAK